MRSVGGTNLPFELDNLYVKTLSGYDGKKVKTVGEKELDEAKKKLETNLYESHHDAVALKPASQPATTTPLPPCISTQPVTTSSSSSGSPHRGPSLT